MQILEIPSDQIEVDPNNPRKHFDPDDLRELADSIAVIGIVVLLVVRRISNNRFMIVDGCRRFLAGKMAELKTFRAVVVESDTSEVDIRIAQLFANSLRADLNPVERLRAFQELMKTTNCSAAELTKRLGTSKSTVSRTLKLANLPPEVLAKLECGGITAAEAYQLAKTSRQPKPNGSAGRTSQKAKVHRVRMEMGDEQVELCSASEMDIDGVISVLMGLLKTCRKAKAQSLSLATVASMIRDKKTHASEE